MTTPVRLPDVLTQEQREAFEDDKVDVDDLRRRSKIQFQQWLIPQKRPPSKSPVNDVIEAFDGRRT